MEQADTNDTFFCKVVLNLLKDFTETYSEYSLLHRMAHDPLLEGPWFAGLRKSISEAVEGDRSMLGVSVVRSLMGRREVHAIVNEIFEAHPELKVDIVPRETSKTLGDLLELSPLEIRILDSACRFSDMNYQQRSMLDNIDMRFKTVAELYRGLLGGSTREAQNAAKGILFNAGIVSKEGCAPDGLYGLNGDLQEVFLNKNLKIEEIDEAMFPHMLETDLTLDDYGHVSKEIARCIDLIESGQKKVATGKGGVNVMFWGLAGCGKTELAVAMAKARGWNLKVIGDISPDKLEENSRASRLTSLKLATKIFRNKPKTVLLFDEMEDLFKQDNNAQFSKAFINRIIETTNIPIIWTTNSLEMLGQPVLRRMVYNIGFEIPPEEVRGRMWQKYADTYRVKVDPEALKKVAKVYAIAPALIRNAMRVTSTAFGRKKVKPEDLTEIVGSLDTLVNYGFKNKKAQEADEATPSTYDLSCVNTDHDLTVFTDRLVNTKQKGFALCMYGPPGTGKSEYGRYLAHQMGKEVLFKRASDLQSMWVGECEKNIAAAFAEAKKKGMVLLIDEGDTFLRDRTKARQSWEVSQVNEMLSQMERHPEPFILTTNLMNDLDSASLRRFTFKLKFDFMKPDQSLRLFKGFFGQEAPREIADNRMLVPGDYANVKRQVDILGIDAKEEIAKMLTEETKLKPGHRGQIGIR